MDNFLVTLVQSHLDWEAPQSNLDRFTALMEPLAGKTDLIILPEMFTTGFAMQPAPLAESSDGPTLEWMKKMARQLKAVVTGSIIAEEAGKYYNRLYWVEPGGRVLHYDKRHLFGMAGEGDHYASGQERLIIDYEGWRICPLICYDLRFPVWSRNTEEIDLLIYVANVIQAQLLYLHSVDPRRDITMYINSPGGSVTAGLDIYDTMQHVSPDVVTTCTSMAASMSAVLLCAGAPGKRSILPHGRAMIHQPGGGMQGKFADMQITYELFKELKHDLYSIMSKHSRQSMEQIEQDADRDNWMRAEEDLAYGSVDEVL